MQYAVQSMNVLTCRSCYVMLYVTLLYTNVEQTKGLPTVIYLLIALAVQPLPWLQKNNNLKCTEFQNVRWNKPKCFSFRGFFPLIPGQGLCAWTPLGAQPHTPITGSRSALTMRYSPHWFSSLNTTLSISSPYSIL